MITGKKDLSRFLHNITKQSHAQRLDMFGSVPKTNCVENFCQPYCNLFNTTKQRIQPIPTKPRLTVCAPIYFIPFPQYFVTLTVYVSIMYWFWFIFTTPSRNKQLQLIYVSLSEGEFSKQVFFQFFSTKHWNIVKITSFALLKHGIISEHFKKS